MKVLDYGSHSERSTGGLGTGALFLCTTHRLVYQTVDGGRSWASWGDLAASEGGAGVTNDAPAGSVAVSDGTDLTGSANLTWDEGDTTLGLASAEVGTAVVQAIGIGAHLHLKAGDGDAETAGGNVMLMTGSGDGSVSGSLAIYTGSDVGDADSGSITIQTGIAVGGQAGQILLQPAASAEGGNVVIGGGTGETDSGGKVTISAGAKLTGGSDGTIEMYSGDSAQSVVLDNAGLAVSAIGFYGNAPSAQPAAVADATTDVDVITRFNELMARLRTLGLIDT